MAATRGRHRSYQGDWNDEDKKESLEKKYNNILHLRKTDDDVNRFYMEGSTRNISGVKSSGENI